MFSTEILTFLIGFAIVAALVAAFYAGKAFKLSREAADWGHQAYDWVQKNNAKSLSLAQLADLEAQMTEMTDSYHALLASHKKLRSRIGMRELREKRANGKEPPEDEHYEAKKRRLREEAKQKGFLK